MNIIGLLDRPTGGSYFLNGREIQAMNDQGGFVLHGFLNPPNEITAGLDILPAL